MNTNSIEEQIKQSILNQANETRATIIGVTSNNEVVSIKESLVERIKKYKLIANQLKLLKAEQDLLKMSLMEDVIEAKGSIVVDVFTVSISEYTSTTIDTAAAINHFGAAIEPFVKRTPVTRLNVR